MIENDTVQRLQNSAAGAQWKSIGVKEHQGLNTPLFSLHTKNSCGIGEYPDLIPLINWCAGIGLDVIQLLPLNDIGLNTSPYCALSAYALNTIHIGLSHLPYVQQDDHLKQTLSQLQSLTQKTQRIDYRAVQKGKEDFLRTYYQNYGAKITAEDGYRQFKAQNNSWLPDYALFKALKIRYEWQSWESWPLIFKDPSPNFFESPPTDLAVEAEYHVFLQYLAFMQFADLKRHAKQCGVLIKGDIPILIDRESADVWRNRHLFLLQFAAGAPPDMYSKDGQKWGFPLYNWDVIGADQYRWWIDRLNVAAQLYHIYRIDHIVGFFRIWGIPLTRPARDGYFIPEDRNTWIAHGETIMRVMLENCDILPIGEDLGTVPPEVRICLKSLGICGTKVMRWERRWDEDRGYICPKDYPPESMTTVSTHDSETLAQWWKNEPKEAKLYAQTQEWEYTPELSKEQRLAILRDSHHSGSLFHINLLQEYLALIPGMTWPNPDDERINLPGIISDNNWSYRYRPSLEEIVENPDLKQCMTEILA